MQQSEYFCGTAEGKAAGIKVMAAVKAVAIASRRDTLIFTALRSVIDRTLLLNDRSCSERAAKVGIAKPSAGVTTAAISRTVAKRLIEVAIFASKSSHFCALRRWPSWPLF
jgi:hypothetical protein